MIIYEDGPCEKGIIILIVIILWKTLTDIAPAHLKGLTTQPSIDLPLILEKHLHSSFFSNT